MEHIVKFIKGFDCIKFECAWDRSDCKPRSGGSHGVHGLEILFISKGEKGAVQFLISTGWLPRQEEQDNGYFPMFYLEGKSYLADLGYHSKQPMFEGHTQSTDSCPWCGGEPCYYDGSGLNASLAGYTLVNGGDEALWEFLDGYYNCIFEGADFPAVKEYDKPVRGGK